MNKTEELNALIKNKENNLTKIKNDNENLYYLISNYEKEIHKLNEEKQKLNNNTDNNNK